MEYPNKHDVQERAAAGQPISQEEVSSLEREERDMTGWGPVPGGTAGMSPNLYSSPRRSETPAHNPLATAQSLHDRQMNFIAKEAELARKPADDITKDDAAEIQKLEVRQPARAV